MIAPYKHPRPHRELAWLIDAESVLSESGRRRRLSAALSAGVQVWGRSEHLRELTRAGTGSCVLWRYVPIGWSPDADAESWPVRGLVLDVPDDPAAVLDGLGLWRDWLESFGASPSGSLGGSGLSLVKATLTEPLWTSAGDLPPIHFTAGGRQDTIEPTPAHYRVPLTHCDIQAAYAQKLGAVFYGGRWARFDWKPRADFWRKCHDAGAMLFVRAQVELPELPELAGLGDRRGPLLVRPRSRPAGAEALFWSREPDLFPAGKTIQGTWSMSELDAAEQGGAKIVRVLDVWHHGAGARPFAPWLEAVWKGRDLGGFAGRLAKATGNATWGQFAIAKGRRKVVSAGRERTLPMRGGNPSQRAFDLAEFITGQIRAELWLGYLEAGELFVSGHTDGLWSRGLGVRGWRTTGEAVELRIFDAQNYACRLRGSDSWNYTVAGVLDPAEYFERTWSEAIARGIPTPLEARSGQTARAEREKVKVIE